MDERNVHEPSREPREETGEEGVSSKPAAQPLLTRLRHDSSLSDCILEVGKDEFAAHSLILRTISPFFENALCGMFKEAATKRLRLGETTSRAVHVLLDYAYEISGVKSKLEDALMAREVWELAHRLDVRGLGEICARRLLDHMTLENAVEMLQSIKELDCSIEIVNFIASHFSTVKNVRHLDEDSLKSVLISPHLAATEMELITVIKQWTEYHSASDSTTVCNVDNAGLLETIRFELLSLTETAAIFNDGVRWIPKESLMDALKAQKDYEERMGVLNMLRNPANSGDSRWLAQACRRTLITPDYKDLCTVLVPIPPVENGRFTHEPVPVYFKFYYWILSACVNENFGEIGYRIVFERRTINDISTGANSDAGIARNNDNNDILGKTKFKVSTKLCGADVTTEDFPIMFRTYYRPRQPHGKTWCFRVQTQTELNNVKGTLFALIALEA